MSPLAPSQQKRIPLLAVGAVAALGFAVWNVQHALQPPLRTVHPVGSLERVSNEVQRTLPLPSTEGAPTTGEPLTPEAKAPKSEAAVSEENLSPGINPFVPLPGRGQYGQQFVTAASPQYEAMPQLPAPAYIPEPITPMRLATATVPLPPQKVRRRAPAPPAVSIRPADPAFVGPAAPVLPAAAVPASTPAPAPAAVAKPEPPPTLVGTLLGDQPSAVFQVGGNITIVPAGGMVAGWQLLTVEHGQAVLKNVSSGLKIPVLVAAESTTAVK
jgi:hypothetical protein